MFFNKALNLYLDRFYSAFKPIVYNEIDSSKKTLISPSQETMDRLLPIIQQLQQSYPAELTVLQTEKIPFFATCGTVQKGLLLVNEQDLKNLSDSEIQFILHHEWCHLMNEDSVAGTIINTISSLARNISLGAAIGFGIAMAVSEKSVNLMTALGIFSFPLGCHKVSEWTQNFFEKKSECRADRFALDITKLPPDILRSLDKSTTCRLSEEQRRHVSSLFEYRFQEAVREPAKECKALNSL